MYQYNDVWDIRQQVLQNVYDQNANQQAFQWRKNEKYNKEAENNTWQLHFVPQSKQDNAPSTDLKSTSDTSAISNLHFGGNEKETREPTT